MMDVSCDACGKRYRIDDTRMKSDSAKVKCKACGHLITVVKPQATLLVESIFATGAPAEPAAQPPPPAPPTAAGVESPGATMRAPEPAADEPAAELAAASVWKRLPTPAPPAAREVPGQGQHGRRPVPQRQPGHVDRRVAQVAAGHRPADRLVQERRPEVQRVRIAAERPVARPPDHRRHLDHARLGVEFQPDDAVDERPRAAQREEAPAVGDVAGERLEAGEEPHGPPPVCRGMPAHYRADPPGAPGARLSLAGRRRRQQG